MAYQNLDGSVTTAGKITSPPCAKWVATFSIATAFIIVAFDIFVPLLSKQISHLKIIIESVIAVFGLALGVGSMVLARKQGSKGIFGIAIIGICLNGLLIISIPVLFLTMAVLTRNIPKTAQGKYEKAMKKLDGASSEITRFYALDDAAKKSFAIGKIEDARKYAEELLKTAPSYPADWNYGNAIQDGNLILGRIAFHEGRIEDAKRYLIAEGNSPGSPTMDTFGPNMSLAKDLLSKNEREAVLQYFEKCRSFWSMDNGKLDEWSKDVKAGKTPSFGANLVY